MDDYYDNYYTTERRKDDGSGGLAIVIGYPIICFFLALFANPILFDSVMFSVLCWLVGYFGTALELHPAIYVLIALAAGAALYFLQITAVGFWLVSIVSCALKTFVITCYVYRITGENMAFVYLSIVPAFAGLLWLRIRNRKTAWDVFHLKYRLA